MSDREANIDQLEMEFPALLAAAFAAARENALKLGHSIVESENGAPVEVFPDGSRRFIKKIEDPIPVTRGSRIQLK